MKVSYSEKNTHIEDSYQIKLKKSMENEMDWIIASRKARKYPVTRTIESYVREWKGHNNLYNIFIRFKGHKRIDNLIERTRSVDLEEPQSIFWRIIWLIIGR